MAATCHICGNPATCFGAYEKPVLVYACDRCCGHGNEDGWCRPVSEGGLIDLPLTDEEAQAAYDAAPEIPISEDRIAEIVRYATGYDME